MLKKYSFFFFITVVAVSFTVLKAYAVLGPSVAITSQTLYKNGGFGPGSGDRILWEGGDPILWEGGSPMLWSSGITNFIVNPSNNEPIVNPSNSQKIVPGE